MGGSLRVLEEERGPGEEGVVDGWSAPASEECRVVSRWRPAQEGFIEALQQRAGSVMMMCCWGADQQPGMA